jgi:hypothetical protein
LIQEYFLTFEKWTAGGQMGVVAAELRGGAILEAGRVVQRNLI